MATVAAASAADRALARQTLAALEQERLRREEGWIRAQEEWHAIARRFKQEARLRLASAAQNPSVTDAYFDPPPYLRNPVSGAPNPISGAPNPAGGVPLPPPQASNPYGGSQPYPAPLQTYPGQPGVPSAAQETAPWQLAAGAHRPPVDHGGTDRREAGR